MTFKWETGYGETYELKLDVRGRYDADGSVAIAALYWDDEFKGFMPYCDVTVCLCDKCLKENEAYVNENNGMYGLGEELEALGICKSTGKIRCSGYNAYEAYEFDMEKVAEFS